MAKLIKPFLLALFVCALTPGAFADSDPGLDSGSSSDSVATFASDLTSGWAPDRLDFKIQTPYDVKPSDRYTFQDGVYHFWVMSNDKPFAQGNTTLPRTEMRFPDYSKGLHQFEADMMVPAGTNGVTIMQIHTGNAYSHTNGPVAFMFRVHDKGSLFHMNSPPPLMANVYGKWFHLNVINDMTKRRVIVYINDKQVGDYKDPGAPSNYFKCGVYSCKDASAKMEVYIKNIKIWHKD
ncbi:MAG TPA: polysaccharide lyase family 7 protein [Candidatus Methylacidiphilales bacterium]|nr:polysaccharide lyase family 7 protein [Candidatus Methylacidiphilales bacterium]